MNDTVPPDHFTALGLGKDATTAQVKTAYKKAALKYHPDKAQDKTTAADQFHKISQAYEVLVDEDKRRKYEELVKLSQLKKDLHDRRAAPPASSGFATSHTRASTGDVRSPYHHRGTYTGSGSFTTQTRVEERRPRPRDHSIEEDFVSTFEASRGSARKHPADFARSPQNASKSLFTHQEEYRRPLRETARSRGYDKKSQTQTRQRDRETKYAQSLDDDSSSSEIDYFDNSRRKDEDVVRRSAGRRTRSPESYEDRYAGKYDDAASKFEGAKDYMRRSRPDTPPGSRSPPRPPHRSATFSQFNEPLRAPRRDGYNSLPYTNMRRTPSTRQAPTAPPLSSHTRSASMRETSTSRQPLRVSPDEDRRPAQPPSMPHSTSSPTGGPTLGRMANEANIGRRATDSGHNYDRDRTAQRAEPKRADTTPSISRQDSMRPSSYSPAAAAMGSPRRQSEATQAQQREPLHHGPSNLKYGETNNDSGYSTSNSPTEDNVPHKENVPRPSAATSRKKTYAYTPSNTTGSNQDFMKVQVDPDSSSASSDSEGERPQQRSGPIFNKVQYRPTPTRRASEARVPLSRSPSPRRQEARPEPRSRANSSSQRTVPLHAPHTNTQERQKGPPQASSAKFASEQKERDRDPYHPSKHPDTTSQPGNTPARRPSLSRNGSYTSAKPSLPRSTTTPVPPKLETRNSSSGAKLFREYVESPTEIERERDRDRPHKSDSEGRESGREAQRRDRERERAHYSDRERERRREEVRRAERGREKERERDRDSRGKVSGRGYQEVEQRAREQIERDRGYAARRIFGRA